MFQPGFFLRQVRDPLVVSELNILKKLGGNRFVLLKQPVLHKGSESNHAENSLQFSCTALFLSEYYDQWNIRFQLTYYLQTLSWAELYLMILRTKTLISWHNFTFVLSFPCSVTYLQSSLQTLEVKGQLTRLTCDEAPEGVLRSGHSQTAMHWNRQQRAAFPSIQCSWYWGFQSIVIHFIKRLISLSLPPLCVIILYCSFIFR